MRLFPDHWEKNAMATMILKRLLLPGVLMRLSQPTFAATSRSNLIAALISSNSYSTSGCPLPNDKTNLRNSPSPREESRTGHRSHGSTQGSSMPLPPSPLSTANEVTRGQTI